MGTFRENRTLTVILIFIAITILWGVSPIKASSADKNPVKIGCLTPLSPPGHAAAGKRISWGAELAIKYINEEMKGVLCGRPVELVVEDDSGTPADGIAGFRKLVQKDGVVGVVGQYHSSVCLAVVPVATDLGVPLFSTGASSSKITESESPYIFSIISLTTAYGDFWVEFAKEMGWKKIAVVAEDTDYGAGLVTALKNSGKNTELEIKSTIYPRTSTDLTPMLLEIKAWKPDIIINAGAPPTAYLVVKQANDIGLFPNTPMIASYNWCTLPGYWEALAEKGKYILFSEHFKKGMATTFLGEWMVSKYRDLHNEDPTYYAINAFGEIMVIAQAINQAQSDNPKEIAEALMKWPYLDWAGVVDFNEEKGPMWHHVSAPLLMFQVTDVKQSLGDTKLIWPFKFGGDGKIVSP